MAKILSQDEIDVLLSTVSAEGDHGEQADASDDALRSIIVYDFKHPNRVSKDQIRTLENLHDNLAGRLGSTLSAVQRAVVSIDLVSVDQITYSELVMSLPNPSNTFTISMEPLEGACLVDLNPTLVFLFIDRLFGGVGRVLETERELTGIERAVISKIAKGIFKEIEDTWSSVTKLDIRQESFETNPQFVQIVPPGETVIVISFQIKMLGSSGLLTICYPFVTLEPIMEDLIGKSWIEQAAKGDQENERAINIDNIMKVTTDLQVRLGTTELSVQDFMQLKPGDVVVLDQKTNQSLDVFVRGRKKFTAMPGIIGKKKGFQVIDVLENKELINVEENLIPDPEQESSGEQGSPPPDDSSQEENLEKSGSESSADTGASEQAIPADEIESPDMAEDEAERLMMEELAKSESGDYQAPEASPDDVSEEEAERQMMAELSKVEGQGTPEDATMVNNTGMTGAGVEEILVAQPAEFGELKQNATTEQPRNIEILMDVKLPISIELGRTEMTVNDILELTSGSVVELNKLAGESVDLLVNNKIIAKGEVVVVDENFGLRITTLLSAEERIKSL